MAIKVEWDYPEAVDLRNPIVGVHKLVKGEVVRCESLPRDCLLQVSAEVDCWVALNAKPEIEDGFLLYAANPVTFRVRQGEWLGFIAEKSGKLYLHSTTSRP